MYRSKEEGRFDERDIEICRNIREAITIGLYNYIYIVYIPEIADYKPVKLSEEFNLTEREAEIVQLIIKGRSNKEISQQLGISDNTVKAHIQNIFRKLDVKNRTNLIYKITSSYVGEGREDY